MGHPWDQPGSAERSAAVEAAPLDGPSGEQAVFVPELKRGERLQAQQRSALRPHVVHEAIRQEGEEELLRPASALAWSGLAAGLAMGFSLVTEGLLRAGLPDEPWRPLVAMFGYSVGFLMAILARQQLFTENTVTVIIPLLARRNLATLLRVLRLWGVVLAANLLGALVFAWVVGNTAIFSDNTRHAFGDIGHEALRGGFGTMLLRAVFSGWLIALMVWLLPVAEVARVQVIIIITYVVGLAGLSHVVAGSTEVLYLVTTGAASSGDFLGRFMIPTLIGNVIGGVSLVAALNHAQVVAGQEIEM